MYLRIFFLSPPLPCALLTDIWSCWLVCYVSFVTCDVVSPGTPVRYLDASSIVPCDFLFKNDPYGWHAVPVTLDLDDQFLPKLATKKQRIDIEDVLEGLAIDPE